MLSKSIIKAIVTAALACCCLPMLAAAKPDSGNRFNVDPRLAPLVERAFTLVTRRDPDPHTLQLADSMFTLGSRLGDTKVQCLSFDVRFNYWAAKDSKDLKRLENIAKQQRQFAATTPHKQYIFSCWARYILLKQQRLMPDVLNDVREFQQEAFRQDVPWGIARSYRFYSDFFCDAGMYKNATLALQSGIDMIKKRGNLGDLGTFYNEMSSIYLELHQFDKTIAYADSTLQISVITNAIRSRSLSNKFEVSRMPSSA